MTSKAEFLARVASRLEGGIPANPIRPIATASNDPIQYTVELADLSARFREAATLVDTEVVETDADGLFDLAIELMGDGAVATSREPLCDSLRDRLSAAGHRIVDDHDPRVLSDVRLGITTAGAGIALTGTVIIDSSIPGSRVVSLLPEIHLAVVHRTDLHATPGDWMRGLGPETPIPSNLVLITGPSRSADIELELTIGVHGPGRLVVALV